MKLLENLNQTSWVPDTAYEYEAFMGGGFMTFVFVLGLYEKNAFYVGTGGLMTALSIFAYWAS